MESYIRYRPWKWRDGGPIRFFSLFFFSSARLYEKFKRKWIPTVNVIVKTNWQQFSMICTLIDHRKWRQMFRTQVEPLPRGSWFHVKTKSTIDKSTLTMENCCRFVNKKLFFNFLISYSDNTEITTKACLLSFDLCLNWPSIVKQSPLQSEEDKAVRRVTAL